jgi:hypothetical protein
MEMKVGKLDFCPLVNGVPAGLDPFVKLRALVDSLEGE